MKSSGNPFVQGLQCCVCGKRYSEAEVEYTCPACGANLGFLWDHKALGEHVRSCGLPPHAGMYRYIDFLPLRADAQQPPLVAGGTPLLRLDRLGAKLGVTLWVKDDGRNPTGSLKDRASSLVVARAGTDEIPIVTTASTGNAGAALAGIAASVGLPAVVFVPRAAPRAKIAQLQIFGARVVLVDGSYDDAFALCCSAAAERGWYCRSTGMNSLTSEGKKTVSLEICEQLAHGGQLPTTGEASFRVPDAVFVSVGDGNIITGVCRGLRDLHRAGLVDRLPRVFGVNSAQSPGCAKAFAEGWTPEQIQSMEPVHCSTRADSIAADLPADRVNAVTLVRETGGSIFTVDDSEILDAIRELARESGIFVEPAAAAAYAGLRKALADGLVQRGAEVVVLATGTGLKDPLAAVDALPAPPVVARGSVAEALAAVQ